MINQRFLKTTSAVFKNVFNEITHRRRLFLLIITLNISNSYINYCVFCHGACHVSSARLRRHSASRVIASTQNKRYGDIHCISLSRAKMLFYHLLDQFYNCTNYGLWIKFLLFFVFIIHFCRIWVTKFSII